ncbi:MAG: metal ABC transporter substrate-binding protein [Synergistaceae bacterium]|jgi:zinc transport system substrate-binding protein|nr:metal ABC transporter substrate-binding protein [Synergistaceae bacterium]
MKKILAAAALSAALFCSFVSGALAAEKLKIITTIFPQYDFARQITGGEADVTMLLRPGSESHSFEPTPQDIIKISGCDMFVYVGGESDDWAERILESAEESAGRKINVVSLMSLVDTVEEEITEGMQEEAEEEEEGEGHAEYDEHVWTSPTNAIKIVNALADRLCELDKSRAELFRRNADAYAEKLAALGGEFKSIVSDGKRNLVVFGDRFPFRYFTDEYGLEYFAAFPGCSTETEASAATVAFLIDKVRAENIPVVFYREFSNEKIADAIGESTGAVPMLMHSCHNVTREDFERGVGYLELMSANAENLRKALN